MLRVEFVAREAARFACVNWHYSHAMPPGALVTIGAWEDDGYIGAVVFGRGASTNIGRPYGLEQDQVCELVRVALRPHRCATTEVVAAAIRRLRQHAPGLRLIVSYADPAQGHVGGIYQAMNWLYAGTTAPDAAYVTPDGRRLHSRQVSSSGVKVQFGTARRVPRTDECERIALPGKHRYLLPLDRGMRRRVAHLALPYPRGRSVHGDTPPVPGGEAGSTPADRSG